MTLKPVKDNVVVPLQKRNMFPWKNEKADRTKTDKKAMRKVELKNLADWCLRNPPESKSEKTPIIQTSQSFQDNGAISKNSELKRMAEQDGSYHRRLSEEKSTTESGEELDKPKMSILRKLCFLLSLNGGVMYVAAFLWFIPCRMPYCLEQQKDWRMNISGLMTSNMEAAPSSEQLSSVMFGISEENGGNLASYSISDGKMKWNTRTNHVLRHVFRNYNHLHEKSEGIPKCVVTAYNYIAALDDSNGKLLWELNITHPDGETIIHKIALAGNSDSGFYILGVSDNYIFVINSKNGSQVKSMELPCSWTIDLKLVWPLENNNPHWILVCEYGDSIEVWTFEEKELLNSALQERSLEKNDARNRDKFNLLFKQTKSSTGAIDLEGDVTRTSDSLVLSWADSVVMVTTQAPLHRPTKAWEVRSWGTIQDPAVTSILSGRFTDPDAIQIAVAVQGGSNSTIYILDAKNGDSVMNIRLGSRSVMSMEKVSGEKGQTDMIVIESVLKVELKNDDSSDSKVLRSPRTYFTIQYNGKDVTYQNIVTSDVFESILIPYSSGAASLLIATRNPEGRITLQRHIVTSQQQETTCHWGVHHNITTVLLLD